MSHRRAGRAARTARHALAADAEFAAGEERRTNDLCAATGAVGKALSRSDSDRSAPRKHAGARAMVGQPRPVRRDLFWLLMTGVRGLLGIAIGDHERAESAYRALLPFAGGPPEPAPRR
jgi:hypothetical protein